MKPQGTHVHWFVQTALGEEEGRGREEGGHMGGGGTMAAVPGSWGWNAGTSLVQYKRRLKRSHAMLQYHTTLLLLRSYVLHTFAAVANYKKGMENDW